MFIKRFGNPLLSFAAPLLILLALLGLLQRDGREKIESLPAILVGSGIIITGFFRRNRRRKMLLEKITNNDSDEN